ncbi:hypothetical protein BDW74DRAFT_28943 [Aspergillus multicolor]|uniref:uncharacterized protein n=1 Tax=Aspergillus multicolor TaxID=41759 RepID=UPI003CCCCAE0
MVWSLAFAPFLSFLLFNSSSWLQIFPLSFDILSIYRWRQPKIICGLFVLYIMFSDENKIFNDVSRVDHRHGVRHPPSQQKPRFRPQPRPSRAR